MSFNSFKSKDNNEKPNRRDSHESKTRRIGGNPTLCRYGDDCRTKGCTFTHANPPKGGTTKTSDCKYDVNCTRLGCHFNHPNGRLIDQKMAALPDSNQQNTASSRVVSQSPHLENRAHQCHQHLSESELVETIDQFLLKVEEFDTNDQESNNSDNEQVLHILEQNALQELRLQKSEFQSAINHLTIEYHSILASTMDNKYNLIQLRRIKQQLERELKHWQSRLPIYARRSDIIENLEKNQVLILKADAGSGKSTQTTQYICDAKNH
ncbi:unnamed protein product [Rotaria magnacalcarata]|uniref:Uncharacterized protein n=2 Tax=Rotaria magnacalcarata TaxID=392030 RepID=A0A814MWG9_9BILA|nr:unnamed protein product [Rotaria magnacalcarata]CAF1207499.1 unnamed protein product [Rotaria magnacalcarata]CAF2178140.1 unnamed protein product [Rotaria magnacalcarata]CAF5009989.1 unnamed protein product [Rotaria magnacalcarata]CAF5057228.1 unnamed protein product [Rotaria magnacalcarata]